MMTPRIWVKELEFNDGSKIELSKNDLVVFVGANNAGKSASIKEIANLISNKSTTKVIKNLIIDSEGEIEDILSFLNNISHQDDSGIKYSGYNFSIYSENDVTFSWRNYRTQGLSALSNVFISMLSTEQRLSAANPAINIRLTSQSPQHPIHFLQKNDNLEIEFSNFFRQAFGKDLIVHRNAGNQVPLYVGERPVPNPGEDRVSVHYLNELEKLDLLHLQGDGMRSFVGVLLHAFISHYSMLFIDEPEAFLHPPQARLLGKMLAKNLPSERQLFLSTHSENFLKGLLDADAKNLKIIRIQRSGAINNISLLNNEDIEEIWNDSLLRHSNILDGLFHSKVIICESDSDSRFFSAILSSLFEDTNEIAPDVLFINVGGKHRIPVAIKALKKLDVPMRIICDFDVLNNINPIKNIYEDLGGVWSDLEADWKLVKSQIESKRPEFLTIEAKSEIQSILSTINERIFPKEKANEIQKVFKKASPWTEAKAVGKIFIPSGEATQAFERMQIKFKEKGFYIVEVGELEGFVRSVGNHGPKWINEVLEKDLKNDPELEVARQFVNQLIN